MSQRRRPYRVGISLKNTPSSGLSVVETLLALNKVVDCFVRKHKKHPKLKPEGPFIKITLGSGKEVEGVLDCATEHSVTLFPKVVDCIVGHNQKMYRISSVASTVIKMSSVDMLDFQFRCREVYPNELSA